MTISALLPCPFCGVVPTIRSNRDTHKLQANHTSACFFDAEEDMGWWPATDECLEDIVNRWNRRTPGAVEEPTACSSWPSTAAP